jgi:predicted DNA-binding protein
MQTGRTIKEALKEHLEDLKDIYMRKQRLNSIKSAKAEVVLLRKPKRTQACYKIDFEENATRVLTT